MADETILVQVPLGGKVATLQFRPDVYRRHVAAARAEGCKLQDYLARRILASGIGEDTTDALVREPSLAGVQTG